ncbi:MAG TPA: DUF4962 domain-containing protein, partial [Candidatus Hydrogenedentes bacterium]|nr:DUF4962 domain-containing protein [Candidatus Hydrogenedentota bacterium]
HMYITRYCIPCGAWTAFCAGMTEEYAFPVEDRVWGITRCACLVFSLFVFALIFLGVLSTAHAAQEMVLDQEPAWNQKPYEPADGAVVKRNPPPFTWVPAKDGLRYVLEVARDEGFSEDVLRIEDIPISTYALRTTLDAGAWHWRYGVQVDEAVALSRARRFTVSGDVRTMPYPDLDAATASVPRARPHLFFVPSQLALLRERAQSGDLKGLCGSLCRGCEEHIGEELVPEPDYVKGSGPERGRNYAAIFRATRPPMDAMERCALAYLLTGAAKYGEEAKRRLLHFFAWDPEGPTAYHHNDEPAMWVMMRGVRAYDWTYDLFTPEERGQVEENMRVRGAQFYNHLLNRRRFHTNPYESHAGRTLGFLGEVALEFIHEWPESREWLDYVLTLFWNIYPAWGKEDGGWHEGPGYWSAYMSFALHFVAPLRVATGIDLMQKPFFRNTPYYLLYTNPPYGKISPFGDGENAGASGGKAQVMYGFSTLLGDPYIRWYAEAFNVNEAGGALGIALKDDGFEAKCPTDLAQARYFPGVGLVSLHTALGNAAEDVHFLIHSDPYGPISHAHADQNAFTLEAFGEDLAICSGYYPWYGSNHHSQWSWESKSSNTITFDGGLGQKKRDPKSKGQICAFEHGEAYDYVCADATQAYQGSLERFVRRVVHVRPGVFVMLDELEAPEPVGFEWRLHARQEMTLDEAGQRVTVERGDARLRVQFLAPEGLVLSQTSGFENPPENDAPDQFHFIASPAQKVRAMRYVAVLMPFPNGGESAL